MCIFCMAALLIVGATLGAVALDGIETRLTSGLKDVRRAVDTDSLVMWKATATVKVQGKNAKQVPVAIHLYKQAQRIRIQILTHDVTQAEAESIQDQICGLLDAKVISRHYPDEAERSITKSESTPIGTGVKEQQKINPALPQKR
jgi:hypothetical protein